MEYKIKMTVEAVHAANFLFTNTPAEGSRVECRCHARCVKALKRDCTEEKKVGEKTEPHIKPDSEWVLGEDHFKYLQMILSAMFKKLIPGSLTVGFDELGDAVDAAASRK